MGRLSTTTRNQRGLEPGTLATVVAVSAILLFLQVSGHDQSSGKTSRVTNDVTVDRFPSDAEVENGKSRCGPNSTELLDGRINFSSYRKIVRRTLTDPNIP